MCNLGLTLTNSLYPSWCHACTPAYSTTVLHNINNIRYYRKQKLSSKTKKDTVFDLRAASVISPAATKTKRNNLVIIFIIKIMNIIVRVQVVLFRISQNPTKP
jgi:hypothetical protein